MASCREVATNIPAVDKLRRDYWTLERSATPTALLLPWFPSASKKNKKIATKSLFTTLRGYVELRKKADVPTLDAIGILLSKGMPSDDTVTVILSIIFTGVINTGINCTPPFISHHESSLTSIVLGLVIVRACARASYSRYTCDFLCSI